jgi:hypothetical protein
MDQLHHRGRVRSHCNAARLCVVVGAIVLALAPISTSAEPWMEDGKTCFCLKNPNVGVVRGCTGTRFGGDTDVTARCSGGGWRQDYQVAGGVSVGPDQGWR